MKWTLVYEEDGGQKRVDFEGPFSFFREDAGHANETWTPTDKGEGGTLKTTDAGPQRIYSDDLGITSIITLGPQERSSEE